MKSFRISAAIGSPELDPAVLDPDTERRIIDDYNALVAGLARENADNRAWWYDWLSSRDRHNNTLLGDLMFLAKAERRLHDSGDSGLTIGVASPALAVALARRARLLGWMPRRMITDRLVWAWRRGVQAFGNPVGAAKVLIYGAHQLWAARRYPIEIARLSNNDVILVTILHDPAGLSAGHSEGAYRDTYFGDLPSRLAQLGEQVLVVGQPLSAPAPIFAPLAGFEQPSVAGFGHVLRWRDVVAATARALCSRISTRGIDNNGELRDVVHSSMTNNAIYVGLATMVERAIARLLSLNPQARILHIYENNPWERAIAFAVSDAPPHPSAPDGRDVRGFLHCAVLPSHLKNHITPEERSIRPAPKRIICTGPTARTLFLSLGAHDPARVDSGCDLRGPDFSALPRRGAPPGKIETVLVILEGLETMVQLLRFADLMARRRADIHFVVREHPAMGLDVLAPMAGISLGPGKLERSAATSLVDAIGQADAVMYQSTTAAMTAGYVGIPLIRLARDGVLSGDPLVGCDALKHNVATAEEFDAALAQAAAMSINRFRVEVEILRRHIDSCLAPENSQTLAPFFVESTVAKI